jgi:cytosine/adenosine deaminase-related metal-dependent hydrolase
MTSRPLRLTARWLLPVSAPPIRDGALLIDEHGRIAAVGPDAAVPHTADADRRDLGNAMLLPGLVNVHTHPELTAFRGLLDDLPFHDWILRLVRAKRGAALSASDYGVAARWCCAESLAAGITCMGATEDSGAALDALRDSGMRGIVYREVFGPAPELAAEAMAGLAGRVAAMQERATHLVRVGISPHAPYTVSDELFRAAARFAAAERLPIAVHAAEADVEVRLVTRGDGVFAEGLRGRGIATPVRGRSTIDLLHRTGILELRPLLIHCVRVDETDQALIADHGACVAHCPTANARLGHGIAPVTELRGRGVTVAIGTDSVGSNNRLDLLGEARTAQILQRARNGTADALTSAELLRMVTIDAARCLGIDTEVGSLEIGKAADLCAVRLDTLHTQPDGSSPLDTLFHAARGSDVMMTMVAGQVLFDQGRLQTLDAEALNPSLTAIAQRLRAAMAGS